MDHLLNLLSWFAFALLIGVLVSVRRAHIRVEYSVSWLAAAVVLLIFSRSRFLLEWITRFLGLSDPPLALIIMVFCVFLVVFYRFSVVISALKDANIAMVQRLAILEFQIEAVHEEQQALKNQQKRS